MQIHLRNRLRNGRKLLLMVVVILPGLAVLSGCPPNPAPAAAVDTPDNNGYPNIRTGAWMFMFYVSLDGYTFSDFTVQGGIQLNADGSTEDFLFNGTTFPASSWSQVNDDFEMIHEPGGVPCAGKVINSRYIEGFWQTENDGGGLLFAAHFVTADPDQLPIEVAIGTEGRWLMTDYTHVWDNKQLVTVNSGGGNIIGIEMVLNADGVVSKISGDGSIEPNYAVWSQNGNELQIVRDDGLGETYWVGQVIAPNYVVGDCVDWTGRMSTFTLRWTNAFNPVDGLDPIDGTLAGI